MSGLVSLQGDGLSATFADGRLSGLQRAQAWTLGAGPADSYLIAGGRFLPLESESAFSFEQGQDSGLRSVLKAGLDGGQVELVIQACFREGREDLELDFRLRFPELSPELDIQGVVPLELPVFALAGGEQATVSAELLGGGSHTAILEAEEGETLFTGSRLSPAQSRRRAGPGLLPRRPHRRAGSGGAGDPSRAGACTCWPAPSGRASRPLPGCTAAGPSPSRYASDWKSSSPL